MFDQPDSALMQGLWTARIGGIKTTGISKGCMSECIEACNGHGRLKADGSCECEYFYSIGEANCRVPCSGRGEVRQDGCECLPHITGPLCETVCTGHGQYDFKTLTCTCETPPWTAEDCSVPCLGRGNLSSDATSCLCFDKFSGPTCQTECLGRGKRSGTLMQGKCECDFPFSGDECEIECYGKGTYVENSIPFYIETDKDPFCASSNSDRCPQVTNCVCFSSLGWLNQLAVAGSQSQDEINAGLSCQIDGCSATRSACAPSYNRKDVAWAELSQTDLTWSCLCGECLDGFTGTAGNANEMCTPICGDGQVRGTEQCDDGHRVSGDGCGADCQFEQGWACTVDATSGATTCFQTTCGDGLRQGNADTEACDDANVNSGDGCNSTCGIETGYLCNADSPSGCDACGNGIVFSDTEACDDGNVVSGDGCSETCNVENGYVCIGTANSTCTLSTE